MSRRRGFGRVLPRQETGTITPTVDPRPVIDPPGPSTGGVPSPRPTHRTVPAQVDIRGSALGQYRPIYLGPFKAPLRLIYAGSFNNGRLAYLVAALGRGPIESISIYVDDELLTLSGGKYVDATSNCQAWFYDGSQVTPDTASGLSAWDSRWTGANATYTGEAFVVFKISHGAKYQRIPNIRFEGEGFADVYDPRTASSGYSENYALLHREVRANTDWGLGIDSANLDDTKYSDAADACEATVFPATPTTAPTPAVGGAGSVPAGTYTYKVTFRNSNDIDTLPGPESGSVVLGATGAVDLTSVPTGNSETASRAIYRKESAESEFTLVGTIADNVTTTFTDTAAAGTDAAPTVAPRETRYLGGIALERPASASDWLRTIEAHCLGIPTYSSGLYGLLINAALPGGYSKAVFRDQPSGSDRPNINPATFRLSGRSARELWNSVEVVFSDRDNGFSRESVIEQRASVTSGDEMERRAVFQLHSVDKATASRLARHLLNLEWDNVMCSFRADRSALEVDPHDVITVNGHGVSQDFRVAAIVPNGEDFDLFCREYQAASYADAVQNTDAPVAWSDTDTGQVEDSPPDVTNVSYTLPSISAIDQPSNDNGSITWDAVDYPNVRGYNVYDGASGRLYAFTPTNSIDGVGAPILNNKTRSRLPANGVPDTSDGYDTGAYFVIKTLLESGTESSGATVNAFGGANASVTNAVTVSAGTTNDLDIEADKFSYVELDPSAGAATVTGIVAGSTPGQSIVLKNVSAVNAITFEDEALGSAAANRFVTGTGGDFTLEAEEIAIIVRDGDSDRWMLRDSKFADLGKANTFTASPQFLDLDQDAGTYFRTENADAGLNAHAYYSALSDTSSLSLVAHGSGRTLSRFGQTLGGYSELLSYAGSGLIVGTSHAAPVILGANDSELVRLTSGIVQSVKGGVFIGQATDDYAHAIVLETAGGRGLVASEQHTSPTTLSYPLDIVGGGIVQRFENTYWQLEYSATALKFDESGGAARLFIDGSDGDFVGGDYAWIQTEPGYLRFYVDAVETMQINSANASAAQGGPSSIAIGREALNSGAGAATGWHIAIGYQAGRNAVPTNNYLLAIGREALKNVSSGARNIGIGYAAGEFITTGSYNILLGHEAGVNIGTGAYNVAVGHYAADAGDHTGVTAIGHAALTATTGNYNTAVGLNAGLAVTAGIHNTIVGASAADAGDHSYVTAVGYSALTLVTSNYQTAVGYQAGAGIVSGPRNTLMGAFAGDGADHSYMVAMGYAAATAGTATSGVTAIGYAALTATTASWGTAVGYGALISATTGTYNVALGRSAGAALTTGVGNLFLGSLAGHTTTAQAVGVNYSTAIGYESYTDASFQIALGRDQTDYVKIRGGFHRGYVEKSANYTVTDLYDCVIFCTHTIGSITITLPAPSASNKGMELLLVWEGLGTSSAPFYSGHVGGTPSSVANFSRIHFISDGTTWWSI